MAHYAFIDSNNIVTEVIVGKDENEGDINWEEHYSQFRNGMRCLRTSYNTWRGVHAFGGVSFRKNYAGIGYKYDDELDAFIPPKPYPSWVFNIDACSWDAPVPIPNDGVYGWNEETLSWEKIE
jgi:hypothetical protein